MEYVNFGNSGVKVSQIALGLAFRGQTSADEAQHVIEHAISSGINFIDCGNIYNLGDHIPRHIFDSPRSEEILGRVLKTKRNDVVITTKVKGRVGSGPNNEGLSRYHIMHQVEQSLRRLATDHIDVYLLHGFDHETSLEETVRAIDDLVSQGKVLYTGCCGFDAWQVCKTMWVQDQTASDPLICVQNQYNLLARGVEREMFELARDQDLGILVSGPLAMGLLSGTYTPGESPPQKSLWANKR